MYQAPKLFISYKYVEAANPKELEKKMLQLQVSAKAPLDFTPPQYAKGKWTVWFMYDFSQEVRPEDKIKMEAK